MKSIRRLGIYLIVLGIMLTICLTIGYKIIDLSLVKATEISTTDSTQGIDTAVKGVEQTEPNEDMINLKSKNLKLEPEFQQVIANEIKQDAIPRIIEPVKSNQTALKLPVVYNVDVLRKELAAIHDKLYEKQRKEPCKIRPAGCVILGVAKSGTQELLEFLSLHPNVVPKYNLPNPNLFDVNSHLDSRKEHMPCTYSDQIGIVKTDYFFFRDGMANKFYQFNKDLKMILIVREPVERLISCYTFSYLQKKQHKLEFTYRLKDIPDIDNVFIDPVNGTVKSDQFDVSHSIYDVPMKKYLELFSREQILVLESSEFRENPVEVLQRVEKFLDLKPVITDEYFVFNQDKNFYCLKNKKMFCYGSDRGRAKLKEIKPRTKEILKDYYKTHNKRFFDLIGQTFNW